jgi:hypothetical protein
MTSIPAWADRAALDTPARLIVTADDLGLDEGVNAAVVRSFTLGLVSHASLIVNLQGFQDACRLARAHRLQNRIGLHLNLTEGAPLTEGIRRTPLCADGRFVPVTRFRYYNVLSAKTRRAVADETAAQIASARSAGIPLTHLDSHNDIHTAPSVAGVVTAVAEAHGIPRIRLARNCGPTQGVIRWLHHRRYNNALMRRGLTSIRYFGSIDDLLWLCDHGARERNVAAEAMTHPRLTTADDLIDAPATEPLAQRLQNLKKRGFAA